MPITENTDLPRISADLAKARQRVWQLEESPAPGPSLGPDTFSGRHITESPEQFAARNPHLGRALENQLKQRRADVARLEREYLDAMLAAGKWTARDIIRCMPAEDQPQ